MITISRGYVVVSKRGRKVTAIHDMSGKAIEEAVRANGGAALNNAGKRRRWLELKSTKGYRIERIEAQEALR